MDQIAVGVGLVVSLWPLCFLAGIITACTATLGRLHALAVNHAGTWRGRTPGRLLRFHKQHVVDRQPKAVVAPKIERAPNCGDRRTF